MAMLHAQVVGEEYLLLGSSDVERVIQKIVAARPDFILNTINGDTNVAFFRGLRAAGITLGGDPHPVVQHGGGGVAALWAWSTWWATTRPGATSRAFPPRPTGPSSARFQARYGADQVLGDPMEAAYTGVHLWARAVQAAGTDEPEAVRAALRARAFLGPGGLSYVDPQAMHAWRAPRIGRIRADGQFDIVWSEEKPTRPVLFPLGRSRPEWEHLVRVHSGEAATTVAGEALP